jgi:hypothetical protein
MGAILFSIGVDDDCRQLSFDLLQHITHHFVDQVDGF